jgi:2-dehydro-3-deoxygluconokinase
MTIFIFGEVMLEYHSHGGPNGLRYGGDTLNTAIHLARMGLDVAYVTAVGTDPISDALVGSLREEGLDTRYVLRHPARRPGIYAIHLDAQGERSFLYWRDRSAAREMFALPAMANVMSAAEAASLLYFSLISLAILPEEGRAALLALAQTIRRNGGQVAYDSNYRSNLWVNADEACRVSNRAIAVSDFGFPTNVDERQLRQAALSERDIAVLWQEAGCTELVVKAGEQGCFHANSATRLRHFAAHIVSVVDSSGAGDAFNAGFLASRRLGQDVETAITAGQYLAAWVIQRNGAIPPRTAS